MEADFKSTHVHIIGLGLMGGSLAIALRGKVAHLSAEDHDPAVIANALEQGIIEVGERQHADVVVLAIPVHHMPALLAELPATLKAGALVIDLGSTKTQVCAALDTLPASLLAVGGHPMCGLAENTFKNATGSLYQNARFILCETARTTPPARDLAEALVAAIGAIPLWLDRERHDFLTAMTSHLPHLLNFGLMALAMDVQSSDPQLFDLAAGGFDGATRLARTEATMITGMLHTNAPNLRELTHRLIEHLQEFEQLLDEPTLLPEKLASVVEARRTFSQHYGERRIS
jgi:prephenate dehydrogenase